MLVLCEALAWAFGVTPQSESPGYAAWQEAQVCHFGGDRFAVGLFGLTRLDGAVTVARKLCSTLARPISFLAKRCA